MAICVFRRRVEEHKVLFVIAVVSTVKMTTGSQFKAAPCHSSLCWPAVVIPSRNVGSLSLPQGLSLPCSDSTARLGTCFLFGETAKKSNYFQCFRDCSSVQTFKKDEEEG